MAADSSSSIGLRIGRVLHGTTAEGPGLRSAVWVQGCSIRCAGCINPQLFAAFGGTLVYPQGLIDDAERAGVEGITLLGGEPFDQAIACAAVAVEAHDRGLGVICFTGYTHAQAATMPGGVELLKHVDLLVDGPFVADQPEHERALVGSANQRFIHISDRYRSYEPVEIANRIHLRIANSGEIDLAGFLTSPALIELSGAISARRTRRR